jgi:hypothetical protein
LGWNLTDVHPVRRRVLVVLVVGGLTALVVAALIPVLLGARGAGLRASVSLPPAPATLAAEPPVEIVAEVTTSEPSTVLDEQFDDNRASWPVRMDGTVWFAQHYHLNARFPARFVAVRDRSPVPLDGARQDGQYYVFETSDLGEVGAWRRDESTWIELMASSRSAAVRTGLALNQLTVRASGNRFHFEGRTQRPGGPP